MLESPTIALAAAGICLCALTGTAVRAAELGDADAGFAIAEQLCAGCHNITSRNPVTTETGIPAFATVANNSGMTRTSLVVWMQTSHPKMPNFMLTQQDLDHVIAYILSLKKS